MNPDAGEGEAAAITQQLELARRELETVQQQGNAEEEAAARRQHELQRLKQQQAEELRLKQQQQQQQQQQQEKERREQEERERREQEERQRREQEERQRQEQQQQQLQLQRQKEEEEERRRKKLEEEQQAAAAAAAAAQQRQKEEQEALERRKQQQQQQQREEEAARAVQTPSTTIQLGNHTNAATTVDVSGITLQMDESSFRQGAVGSPMQQQHHHHHQAAVTQDHVDIVGRQGFGNHINGTYEYQAGVVYNGHAVFKRTFTSGMGLTRPITKELVLFFDAVIQGWCIAHDVGAQPVLACVNESVARPDHATSLWRVANRNGKFIVDEFVRAGTAQSVHVCIRARMCVCVCVHVCGCGCVGVGVWVCG